MGTTNNTNMTKDEKVKAHLAALKKITGADYEAVGNNNGGDFSAENAALKSQIEELIKEREGMKKMLKAQNEKKGEEQNSSVPATPKTEVSTDTDKKEIKSDEFPPFSEIEKIKDEYVKNAKEIFALLQTKDEDRFDKIQAIINAENEYGRVQAKLVCFHNIYEEILSTYNSEKNKEGFEITKLKSNFLERIETDFAEYPNEIEDVYYHLYNSVLSFRAEKEERKIYEEARRSYEESVA